MCHSKVFELPETYNVALSLDDYMYSRSEMHEQWNSACSTPFFLTQWSKTGGVFSPILLYIYIDSLLQKLQDVT